MSPEDFTMRGYKTYSPPFGKNADLLLQKRMYTHVGKNLDEKVSYHINVYGYDRHKYDTSLSRWGFMAECMMSMQNGAYFSVQYHSVSEEECGIEKMEEFMRDVFDRMECVPEEGND